MDQTPATEVHHPDLLKLIPRHAQNIIEVGCGYPRILDEPRREKFLPSVRAMAISIGADGDMAVNDAIPFQYLIRAVPAGESV